MGYQDADYQDAIEFLFGLINFEKMEGGEPKYKFRLARMRDLVTRLGMADLLHHPAETPSKADALSGGLTPPPPLLTVHVAGTKGKGSTATMVAAMLSVAGIRTGLYTSPHLHYLEERFRLDVQPCSRQLLVSAINQIKPVVLSMATDPIGAPSFFESTTALALLIFRQEKCQVQVIEVGLGGRLDSTNVIQSQVAAITSISLDHTNILGSTVGSIAAEKAGIIKSGVPIISGVRATKVHRSPASDQAPYQICPSLFPDADPAAVIGTIASQQNASLIQLGRDFDFQHFIAPTWGGFLDLDRSPQPSSFDSNRTVINPGSEGIKLGTEGAHQAGNAAVAMMVLDQLAKQGLSFDQQVAQAALADLTLIGRVERIELTNDQTAIIDTAHNQDSVAALCECLTERFQSGSRKRRIVFVFGTSRDKDAALMLQLLANTADSIVLTRFHRNPRFQALGQLHSMIHRDQFKQVEEDEDPKEAVKVARQIAGPGGVIVICGSFFLADETRIHILNQRKSEK